MMDTAARNQALQHVPLASPWNEIDIDRSRKEALIDQIAAGVTHLVTQRQVRIGTRMPSVRQFAKVYGVSNFTVVEAYNGLVVKGVLTSRPGSGYFVANSQTPPERQSATAHAPPGIIDQLMPEMYSGVSRTLPIGAGWLPPEWTGQTTIVDAMRQVARLPTERLRGYGDPQGLTCLRQHMAGTLSNELLAVEPDQIILTHGATHAFDLILRTFTKPGDSVLVEDPGYQNLHGLVRHHGCKLAGIPRSSDGIDFDVLLERIALHKPKLMFINTVLHNPLGTSLNAAQAHRLLAIAEQCDIWIVEDDIFRELVPSGETSLSAMGGLERVIRVGSFSKTLSPTLRAGSICASTALIPELVRVKMLTGLTTSAIEERIVFQAVSSHTYRRSVQRLRTKLETEQQYAAGMLRELGLTPLAKPRGGIFISAGWNYPPTPDCNAKVIADLALQSGILLAPAEFFSLSPATSIWFRFNVVHMDSEPLRQFLQSTGELLMTKRRSRSNDIHYQ